LTQATFEMPRRCSASSVDEAAMAAALLRHP